MAAEMRKWECIVCGLIYDEAQGWPDDGIEPGTRWEDVPEDWLCPDCGVGKEDFELLEEASAPVSPRGEAPEAGGRNAPIVILGTGLAGYGVAREFRKHDSETPLILITSDDGRSYSKPMLSTGFTRGTDADGLAQLDAGSMGRQLKASVWTMTRVSRIDTDGQLLEVGDTGTAIRYGKLVLTLGSQVVRPPIQGNALEHVRSVNDLLDYGALREAMAENEVRKVCIVGAGLIGCEFTNDLLNGGFEVETVDPLGHCLPTLLPEPAGKAVQRALEERGAKFHFGSLVREVNQGEDGLRVSLDNGETLAAHMVLSAVGVRPRTALAQDAGLETRLGIVTNRLLETSARNVYAIGDCAEVAGHVLVFVAPLMAAARALARTLAGEPTEVAYPAMPVTIKTPACPVVVAPVAADAEGKWSVEEDGNSVKALFHNPAGELLGFALTGKATQEKLALQKRLPAILG